MVAAAQVGKIGVLSSGFSPKLRGETSVVIEDGEELKALTKGRRLRSVEEDTRRLAINFETYARAFGFFTQSLITWVWL